MGASEGEAQPVRVRVDFSRHRKEVQLLGRQPSEVTGGKQYRIFYLSVAFQIDGTSLFSLREHKDIFLELPLKHGSFCQFDMGKRQREVLPYSAHREDS